MTKSPWGTGPVLRKSDGPSKHTHIWFHGAEHISHVGVPNCVIEYVQHKKPKNKKHDTHNAKSFCSNCVYRKTVKGDQRVYQCMGHYGDSNKKPMKPKAWETADAKKHCSKYDNNINYNEKNIRNKL